MQLPHMLAEPLERQSLCNMNKEMTLNIAITWHVTRDVVRISLSRYVL